MYPTDERLECDLIMKGGVTSGIVYPKGICKLADVYRLRQIGGSSAGAIAAGAAGAAELGRQTGATTPGAGFAGLAALPEKLGERLPSGESRLRSLFQPSRQTAPAFNLAVLLTEKRSMLSKGLRALAIVIAAAPAFWVLGLLGLAFLGWAGTRAHDVVAWAALALGGLCLLVVSLVAVGVSFARRAAAAVTANGFGLCRGYPLRPKGAATRPEQATPDLTTWVYELFQELAGRDRDGPPLCFGDLEKAGVEVVVTTTNLIERRPHRIPFDEDGFFFRREELARWFPLRVVERMEAGAKKALAESREGSPLRAAALQGFFPMPGAEDLPLVVGVRMSLSFPILLSAVPLYAIDWSRKASWASPCPERVWFSDGGICSNLPIHFFDSLLPTRPTFAVDLQPVHEDHPLRDDEAQNVWVPENNRHGVVARWHRFSETGALGPVRLLGAIVETMQSWNDEMQARVPGYRDRIARVSLDASEGGLNLDMPSEAITRLGLRGEAAGEKLVRRFAGPSFDGWKNHLWVRYRTLAALLDAAAVDIHRKHGNGASILDELIDDPPSYKEGWSKSRRLQVRRLHRHFAALIRWREATEADLSEGAPRPRPQLRVRPPF